MEASIKSSWFISIPTALLIVFGGLAVVLAAIYSLDYFFSLPLWLLVTATIVFPVCLVLSLLLFQTTVKYTVNEKGLLVEKKNKPAEFYSWNKIEGFREDVRLDRGNYVKYFEILLVNPVKSYQLFGGYRKNTDEEFQHFIDTFRQLVILQNSTADNTPKHKIDEKPGWYKTRQGKILAGGGGILALIICAGYYINGIFFNGEFETFRLLQISVIILPAAIFLVSKAFLSKQKTN